MESNTFKARTRTKRQGLAQIFLVALLYHANTHAQTIHYGHPDQFVLTQKLDKYGRADNPLLRLAGALMDLAGRQMTNRAYPAARLFQNLNNGTVNFTLLVKAPTLEDCCIISEHPIYTTELRVYRWDSAEPVQSPQDLVGQRVITMLGYSYGQLKHFIGNPVNHITHYATDTHQSAFAMLAVKRADYLLDYKGPSEEIQKSHPITGVTFDILEEVPIYIVLNKSLPDAAALMTKLEAIITTLDVETTLNFLDHADER